MPDALLERVDAFVDEHGYSGRSEAVRKGTRTLLEEFRDRNVDGESNVCTVTVTFEYCQPAVQQRLTGVRHEYDEIVSTATHTHAGDEFCVELFVLEGTSGAVSEFVNAVRAIPNVRSVNYTVTPLVNDSLDGPVQSH
ncbi:CopG family nickel-responsive transcriptional regulator [Halorubrum alkaliphilum]|uniref:CopG family nickel-responsive transcriptional regulator n=1 Tax=Halorubrum alkaliphilum TaxID=261290 RepID=A0A8T4GHW9_9EURY|nr:CopG family ribbon-helix-helix protein [Halorubrum alkaliphilum]MBP1923866.1 CopG family nickel-responsive transcriptional regulator [Halorubrum alkaliphilum]